ncbi:FtsX-like permease family protein [Clostridium sp. Marseille-Q7071]
MTFKDVVYKNFRYNIKKYLSLFLCNSFTIMVLFMMLDLNYNEEFIQYIKNDISMTSVVWLAILVVSLFAVFFIIYAQTYFIKSRSKEFGLFITVGMSKWELNKLVLIENILIAILSLMMGLISGSIFTRLFFLVIVKVSKFDKISHHFNIKSYANTSILFLLIFIVVLVILIISMNRLEPTEIMKEGRKGDKVIKYNPVIFLLGIFFVITAILIVFYTMGDSDQNIIPYLPLSIVCSLIGLYFIISQVGSGVLHFLKKNKKTYHNHLLFNNEMHHKFNKNKGIIFSCSILIGVTIFGLGIFYAMGKISVWSVDEMYPYNISYSEVLGINNVSTEKINNIINESKTPIVDNMKLSFLLYNTESLITEEKDLSSGHNNVALVSEKELNKCVFNNVVKDFYQDSSLKDIQLKKGEVIIANLSYNRELQDCSLDTTISLENDKNTLKFKIKDIVVDNVYYLKFPMSNYIIILNDEDYNEIKNTIDKKYIGEFNMLGFKEWRRTGDIVEKIKVELQDQNSKLPEGLKEEYSKYSEHFSLFSNIEIYKNRVEGGNFSNFLAVFISFLFFIASSVIIYFKLYTEMEEEKVKYNKLYRIGMREEEFKNIIYNQLKVIFFSPLIFGGIIAYLYLFTSFKIMNIPIELYVNCSYIFIAYLLFQIIYYFIVSRKYVNNIIDNLSGAYK